MIRGKSPRADLKHSYRKVLWRSAGLSVLFHLLFFATVPPIEFEPRMAPEGCSSSSWSTSSKAASRSLPRPLSASPWPSTTPARIRPSTIALPRNCPGRKKRQWRCGCWRKTRRMIRRVMPEDPDSARQALIEGRVTVRALLDVEGKVQRIDRIEGPREFHRAATTAVRQWEFTPAVQSDRQGLDQPAFRLRAGIETRGRWIWVSAMRPCLSAAKTL